MPWRLPAPRCCWSRPLRSEGGSCLAGGAMAGRRGLPTRRRRRSLPAGADGAVPSIAATVPDDIKSTGRLVIGVNVPYAPNEFKNSASDIVGFDVDLMNAVAKTLGLIPEYREALFADIIPSVQRGDIERRDVVVHRHLGAPGVGGLRHLLRSRDLVGAADRVGDRPQRRMRVAGRYDARLHPRNQSRSRPRAISVSRRAWRRSRPLSTTARTN